MSVASFNKILTSTPVEKLIEEQKLISVTPESTLSEALKLMNENMIISVPVIEEGKCLGLIDNVDVMNYMLKQFENIREWIANSNTSVDNVLTNVKVKEVIDFAHGDPMVVTGEGATCESLMKFFISGWSHRAVIKTKKGFGLVSQFDMMKLLAKGMKEDPELVKKCEDILLMDKLQSRSISDETVNIGSQENIFTVLDRMASKKVHAVAVTDETADGKIIGNFSATDFLNLEYGQFKDLSLTVLDFLNKYSPTSLNPVTVEADGTTVANLINLFSGMGLHRLWIVDSGSDVSFPIGVVTLTDVLKIAAEL